MTSLNRRQFISTAAMTAAIAASLPRRAYATASSTQRLRLGLIGCGGRGYGAAVDALLADPDVELVAMADLFPDRLETVEDRLAHAMAERAKRMGLSMTDSAVAGAIKTRASVPVANRFVGWDAYEKLCALKDVDVVLMAAPPVFRPIHLEAALAAGKHVFMEKPVCVDPVGARKMLQLADVADAKKLSVVAGTQRRHQAKYVEGIKRIHDGQIGEIVGAQCYWLQGGYVGANLRHPEIPVEEMAYQVRNWFCYIWSSGDHIVEQHVHNIDVVLWALGRTPVQCVAQGGRGVDLPMPAYGNRFSHFAAEFDFGGLQVASYCRQEPGTFDRVSERIVGTKGVLTFGGTKAEISGEKPWAFSGQEIDAYVQEHADLFVAIRSGQPLNETRSVTASCATAMLGRESAFTGRSIKYDWLLNKSQQNLTPATWAFGPKPIDPLPIPGKTQLV